jgi:50S ribosomal protein L16 3-hydroxylase
VHEHLLGGLHPSIFLKRHWHKLPLLIRGAIPDYSDLLDLRALISIAASGECESRLVLCNDGQYELVHGPLRRGLFRDLPPRNWTLLVQGINHVSRPARDLLSRFSFLPHARLDDLMVSYAAPGGGVGPHVDSYDVFLLQGSGKRRWQVSKQSDLEAVADSPLKILRSFRPAGSCDVACGDMLYLPPHYAHNGVALEPCFTYSIGFSAPEYEELKSQFLAYLDDHIRIDGRYRDPQLAMPAHSGEISNDMITKTADALSRVKWKRSTVVDFLGRYLSEPKPHIVLRPPPNPTYTEFAERARNEGIELHPALPLLFRGSYAFINGEAFKITPAERTGIVALADNRRLSGPQVRKAGGALRTFYDWYGNCFLRVGKWGPT